MVRTIGILFPSTSKGRNWEKIEDSYLMSVFLPSFINTFCKEYDYVFYMVIDKNDRLYTSDNLTKVSNYIMNNHMNIKFISSDGIKKGHVTEMWNRALDTAYNDGCDYFYQCGDDIEFLTKNWVALSVNILQNNDDIGLTGPLDLPRLLSGKHCQPGGPRFIQTQAFFSRKHKEIHGFLFPKKIINWYCDDWMTNTYYPEYFLPIDKCFIKNVVGKPRYTVIEYKGECHMSVIAAQLAQYHKEMVKKYLLSSK